MIINIFIAFVDREKYFFIKKSYWSGDFLRGCLVIPRNVMILFPAVDTLRTVAIDLARFINEIILIFDEMLGFISFSTTYRATFLNSSHSFLFSSAGSSGALPCREDTCGMVSLVSLGAILLLEKFFHLRVNYKLHFIQ